MRNKKIKNKKILWILSSTLFGAIFITSIGTTSFGIGYESYKSIKSIKKVIDQEIDKNHMIIKHNNNNIFTNIIQRGVDDLLYESYFTDSLSTLSKNDILNETIYNNYKQFAFDSFYKNWVKTGYIIWPNTINGTIKNKGMMLKDINLNTFAKKLLDYDLEVAKKFRNKAYIESGYQWIVQKGALSDLLRIDYKNSNFYKEIINMSTDNSNYYSELNKANENKLFESHSTYKDIQNYFKNNNNDLMGNHLLNNKVWFTNDQINGIRLFLNLDATLFANNTKNFILGESNYAWYQNNKNRYLQHINTSEIYRPLYGNAFLVTRVGAVFTLILLPLSIISYSTLIYFLLKK